MPIANFANPEQMPFREAIEFKFPPGTIREIQGNRYILKNSRWHRVQPADQLEDRRSKSADVEETADRAELATDLEKQKPYAAKIAGNSVQITIASKSLDLGSFALERSQVEINLIGKELSISPHTNTIRYKDGRPPDTTKAPGVNFVPAHYPVLRPNAKQIDIHEYLYGNSGNPGILRKSTDGEYVQFANPEQMPFREAIDYFANKTNLDTDSWIEGQGIVQQAAFTVAGAKGVLLQDLRNATAKAINDGLSIAKFAKEFDKIADRYSPDWEMKGDRAWRAQLIYDQNLRQANAAGRYAQMTDPDTIKRRPYWQWKHGDSRNPRPVHLALDGKVFPADSLPFFPPSGFGCKCQIQSLSQRDIDRENLTIENLRPGQDIDYTDPKSGQTRPIKLEPDKGFNWKPEKDITHDRRAEILKNLDPDLRQQVEKEFNPIQVRADRLFSRRANIVAAAGEESVVKAEAAVQKALASTKTYVQVDSSVVESILKNGFKTIFEIPTANPDSIEIRRQAEQNLYGYSADLPASQRPVSGFLAQNSDFAAAPLMQQSTYGNVVFELKQSVRNQTTFTLNDSLTSPTKEQFGIENSWQPSPILDVNIASLVSLVDNPREVKKRVDRFAKVKKIEDINTIKEEDYGYNWYIEAGIHGGLGASGISKIIYQERLPSSFVIEWAKNNKVEIEVKSGS
jgi:Phage Mu protein F like protein